MDCLGVKVHAKMAMIVRREGKIPSAATFTSAPATTTRPRPGSIPTSGLFTCNEEIGADVSDLFNHLTGYSAKKSYRKLLVAPHSMRSGWSA